METFSGPAAPLLSLNPQEDVEFQKEVAQVRKHITQFPARPHLPSRTPSLPPGSPNWIRLNQGPTS
ncbi:hypothetical protein P7K49_014334 [Saguinus oedipus]|uniref:Uncharacterized protein n=1 Tax=Saguinus oedipus TaxID=9490 RepID=A0ABQ9VIG5_SAGOE|nr:hypothetical protein P7K49_014334 [Saguinus oedipus]